MSKSTLMDRRAPADICRDRRWGVGTKLVGDEGYGPTIILITAIGEDRILARAISQGACPVWGAENIWALDCRDWQEVQS